MIRKTLPESLPIRTDKPVVPDEMLFSLVSQEEVYLRTGGCNACGACCRDVVVEVVAPPDVEDWAKWLNLHGHDLVERNGKYFLRVDGACRHLQQDGACGVFGTEERPEMCSDTPIHPDALDGLPSCTYKFTRLAPKEARIVWRGNQPGG